MYGATRRKPVPVPEDTPSTPLRGRRQLPQPPGDQGRILPFPSNVLPRPSCVSSPTSCWLQMDFAFPVSQIPTLIPWSGPRTESDDEMRSDPRAEFCERPTSPGPPFSPPPQLQPCGWAQHTAESPSLVRTSYTSFHAFSRCHPLNTGCSPSSGTLAELPALPLPRAAFLLPFFSFLYFIL